MIYFDHAAAVPVLPEIRTGYEMLLDKYSGNPEAAHKLGHALNRELDQLGEILFDILLPEAKVEHKACFFGNNTVELLNVLSSVYQDPAACAWGSPLEHIATRRMLGRSFGRVCEFPLDSCGRIAALPPDIAGVKFIAITHVQSEIGVMQELPELMKKLRQAAPQAVILVDMVQSGMFYSYPAKAMLPDLLLISGSKLGSDSGAALLATGTAAAAVREKITFLRKKEYLTGKSNAVQAAALVLAAQVNCVQRDENISSIEKINLFLRERLHGLILPNGRKCQLTVPADAAAKNILHFTLPGYQAGVLVRMFSQSDIMLSSGSACQSESDEPSAVLQALNYSKKDAFSGIRLSFAGTNTLSEAEIFLQTLDKILKDY